MRGIEFEHAWFDSLGTRSSCPFGGALGARTLIDLDTAVVQSSIPSGELEFEEYNLANTNLDTVRGFSMLLGLAPKPAKENFILGRSF